MNVATAFRRALHLVSDRPALRRLAVGFMRIGARLLRIGARLLRLVAVLMRGLASVLEALVYFFRL
jgi:hypothetical protein